MKCTGVLLVIPVFLTACQPGLNRQPKLKALAESPFYANGAAARALPVGVVPYRPVRAPAPLQLGALAELRRGEVLYAIHCSACHGLSGEGGVAGERGFNGIPSLHSAKARAHPDLERLIREGEGLMYGMGDRIPAKDIRALAQFVGALQLSQYARWDELSAAERAQLSGAAK